MRLPSSLDPPRGKYISERALHARDLLREALAHERAGRMVPAEQGYESAIDAAESAGDSATLAEALRRFGVVRHLRHDTGGARTLCQRSYETAAVLGDEVLAAEALNTLAGFDFEGGDIDAARLRFYEALGLGAAAPRLVGCIQQNLGILSNIQGDLAQALLHYQQSLAAFQSAGDERGCALAFHNLGMISADEQLWDDADKYFRRSLETAVRIGDVHLHGLCLLNHTEVLLARQQYEDARASAEEALRVFDQLGSRLDKADAYKAIGMVYRETGRQALAEARFKAALELATEVGSVLSEAEASRELALLYQAMGRNQDALKLLNRAHRLFSRLDARRDLVDTAGKTEELEAVYLEAVREWGQSIESADSYTHGHCERVATYAVAVARMLRLDESEQTTMRLGAYLHDVGKVRVPHEILNKPSKLTAEEYALMQLHSVYGLELLAGVEFPWDIKPIIRWHHEKHDGSGYPDGLRGDEIPLGAQIIGIADVFDALTTTRSYRPASTRAEALAELERCRHWWRDDVYEAFLASVGPA